MHIFNSSSKRGKFIRLSILIIGFILPFFFIIFGLPFLSQSFGVAHLHQVIIDEEIDAGAWFWAFVEQYSEIIPRMRHNMQFAPRPPVPPSVEQIEYYYYPDQYYPCIEQIESYY